MATTWAQVKEEFRDSFRDVTQSFISDTELSRMARRILRLIDSKSTYAFQETLGTLTLTGASAYELKTPFPDFKELISLNYATGGNGVPNEFTYTNVKDFQTMNDSYAYTILGSSSLRLYAPGAVNLSGNLGILYYSRYLTIDTNGTTHIEYPTDDAHTFVIPERYINLLVEGLLMLAFRKDRSHREDYTDSKEAFETLLREMILNEPQRVSRPRTMARAAF